jgi:hypothetical protein
MARKNEKYLEFIRKQPCVVCGAPAEVHHQRDNIPSEYAGGMGLKPYDLLSIPLCRECHVKAHMGDLSMSPHLEIIRHLIRFIEGGVYEADS